MNTITLTTLPNGRLKSAAGEWRYRLSVFVSIRLDPGAATDATLKDFGAFADWPALLSSAKFSVDYTADASGEPSSLELSPLANAESQVWTALFHPELPVVPYAPPGADEQHAVRSYDGGALSRQVRQVYASSLAAVDGGASVRSLLAEFNPQPDREVRHPLESLVTGWPEAPSDQFRVFCEATDCDAITAGDEAAPTDFHRAQSAAADFSGLMIRLGLVIPFEADAHQLALPETGLIRTRMTIDGEPPAVLCVPWTAYETDGPGSADLRVFHPRPARNDAAPGRVTAGFVELDSEHVELGQEQVANAVLALGDYAKELRAREPDAEPAPPPALYSGGIALFDRRGETELQQAVSRRPQLETWLQTAKATGDTAAEDETLYADDVTSGYRVDVRCGDGPWRSLCARSVDFTLGRDGLSWQHDDEGTVSVAASQSSKEKLTVSKISDALFEWHGWSLVVPMPGKTVAADGQAREAHVPPDPDFPLVTRVAVRPGSLERQRFGTSYVFRCRAVDLAGQSWSPAEADEISAADDDGRFSSPPSQYVRYEQTGAPLITPANEPGHGESATVVAVGNATRGDPSTLREFARVYVMPPRGSLHLAERHGLFDTLTAEASWQFVHDHQASAPTDYDPDALAPLTVQDRSQLQIRIPYLADPLAWGAVFLGLPGADGPVGPIPFPRQKLEVLSLSLSLRKGKRAPAIKDSDVTVFLPPGETSSIQIMTVPDPERVQQLAFSGLFRQATGGDSSAAVASFNQKLARGSVPLVSPPLELSLVHAVKVPVRTPVFSAPKVKRTLGSVVAELDDPAFEVHAPSTSRVDFEARWRDVLDDQTAWVLRNEQLYGFGVNVVTEDDTPLAGASTGHDYPDTRYHQVTYHAVATTRYAQFFAEDDPEAFTAGTDSAPIAVLSTAPPALPRVGYIVPTFRWVTEAGASRYEVRRRRSAGGLRIYLERPWFSSGDGEQLAVLLAARTGRPVHPAVAPFVSAWGFNPVKRSDVLPPYPAIGDVVDTLHEPLELPIPAAWTEESVPAEDARLALAVYPVEQEPRRGLLYCDVELDPHDSFMPMVQLALARYQRNAVEGAELSPVVRAEFTQLLPARDLHIEPFGARYRVTLQGKSYREETQGAVRTSAVSAHFEARDRGIRDDDLGWRSLSAATSLPSTVQATGEVVWTADLEKPADTAQAVRLVIMERALFETDASVAAGDEPADPQRDGRLVFADAVELPFRPKAK